jgi:small-conductance mechanosensitive channel
MSGEMGRRIALLALFTVVFMVITSAIGSAQSREDPLEVDDYQSLLDMKDEGTGRFGTITTGSFVVFDDKVTQIVEYTEVSHVGDCETHVLKTQLFFASTEDAIGYPEPLQFHGTDYDESLKIGAEVRITIQIKEVQDGNTTVQVIDTTNGLVELIKQGKDDGVKKDDDIEVFGVSIPTTFLPKDYRTDLVRFLLVFAVWAIGTVILWFIVMFAMRLAKKSRFDADHKILSIVAGPFFVILLVYGLLISISQFDLDDRFLEILDMIYKAVTIVIIAYISIKVFKKVIIVYLEVLSRKTDTQADDVLVPVMGKIITVVIWIVAIVMFLRVFGIDVTIFIAGMGIIGLVIAFAAQDTMSNFFAGIMILLDRPFKEGDWIEMDGSTYQVRDIGLRSTRLFHSISNQVVTIPNNRISDHIFSNLSEPNYLGRKTINVGVGYQHDPKRIGEMLVEVVRSHPNTFEDEGHAPHYRFNTFGDSSLDFAVTFWVKDFNDQWRVASELRERIYERFEREGIEIPFPQRVVHLSGKGDVDDVPITSKPVPGDMKNLSP